MKCWLLFIFAFSSAFAQLVPAPQLDKSTPTPAALIYTAPAIVPQIIQHIATTANPAGGGAPNGNNYKLYISPTGVGDTIVLTITGLSAHALTITDSAGDTSPTAICSADNGSTNGLSYIYAFQPSTGVTWIEAAASGTFAQPFDWNVTEFNNVASISAARA